MDIYIYMYVYMNGVKQHFTWAQSRVNPAGVCICIYIYMYIYTYMQRRVAHSSATGLVVCSLHDPGGMYIYL